MDIDGAVALVTGGASGIGLAAARALTKRGATCVLVDLDAERGPAMASELDGRFARADVVDEEQVAHAIAVARELGPLRALVNAAGMGNARRTVDRDGTPFPLDAFAHVIQVNLIGSFNVLRLAAAAMAESPPLPPDGSRGAIVNIASIAAFDGQIGQAAYSASKGGVVGMTLPIARDLAAIGVRVNTIAPGLIDTPIYGSGEESERFKAHLGESVLFPRRLGTADELAAMVVELVTNDYMNGEVVRVDGGIRMPPR
jgi:NAD(P)-dependent dehydrogenase (short-subunit alcohol dehydrogenase family)